MAFIVETGAIVTNANSYLSVADADAYHTLLNNQNWTALTDDNVKQSALIKATQSIELLYGQRYLSFPQTTGQSLLFPRYLMVINWIQLIAANTVPKQLKNAVAEVALMVIDGVDVFPLPNTNNMIKSIKNKVGEIESDITYSANPITEKFTNFNKIDLILAPLLRKGNTPPMLRL